MTPRMAVGHSSRVPPLAASPFLLLQPSQYCQDLGTSDGPAAPCRLLINASQAYPTCFALGSPATSSQVTEGRVSSTSLRIRSSYSWSSRDALPAGRPAGCCGPGCRIARSGAKPPSRCRGCCAGCCAAGAAASRGPADGRRGGGAGCEVLAVGLSRSRSLQQRQIFQCKGGGAAAAWQKVRLGMVRGGRAGHLARATAGTLPRHNGPLPPRAPARPPAPRRRLTCPAPAAARHSSRSATAPHCCARAPAPGWARPAPAPHR